MVSYMIYGFTVNDKLNNNMKKLIKDLVQNQLVKSEQLAEDAVILFFTFTGCLVLMAIAIIIELAI
jgi:hypothetical protein